MTRQHHDMKTIAMDLRAYCARQTCGNGRFGCKILRLRMPRIRRLQLHPTTPALRTRRKACHSFASAS